MIITEIQMSMTEIIKKGVWGYESQSKFWQIMPKKFKPRGYGDVDIVKSRSNLFAFWMYASTRQAWSSHHQIVLWICFWYLSNPTKISTNTETVMLSMGKLSNKVSTKLSKTLEHYIVPWSKLSDGLSSRRGSKSRCSRRSPCTWMIMHDHDDDSPGWWWQQWR